MQEEVSQISEKNSFSHRGNSVYSSLNQSLTVKGTAGGKQRVQGSKIGDLYTVD